MSEDYTQDLAMEVGSSLFRGAKFPKLTPEERDTLFYGALGLLYEAETAELPYVKLAEAVLRELAHSGKETVAAFTAKAAFIVNALEEPEPAPRKSIIQMTGEVPIFFLVAVIRQYVRLTHNSASDLFQQCFAGPVVHNLASVTSQLSKLTSFIESSTASITSVSEASSLCRQVAFLLNQKRLLVLEHDILYLNRMNPDLGYSGINTKE